MKSYFAFFMVWPGERSVLSENVAMISARSLDK